MKPPDYRKLFEAAQGLYVVFDRDLRIVAASDGYLEATRRGREGLVGRSLFEAFPDNPRAEESSHDVAREMYGRVFADGAPRALGVKRYDLPLPGGGFEERYWNVVTTPITGADGRIEYALSRLQDVTDVVLLRRSGASTRASEQRLRELLNIDGIGVLLFDDSGTVLTANDTFLRWTGFSAEDVAARRLTWQSLTPAEHHAVSLAELDRLAATGRVGPYEKGYFNKDGSRRWMLFVGARLGDGTVVEYLLDIGDRKEAERAKRESDARYRDLFDSIDSGFGVLEMLYGAGDEPVDYRFLEVNPAFERQSGLRQAAGRTIRELMPGIERDWIELFDRVARSREPVRFVREARTLGGHWFELYAFPVGAPEARRAAVLFNDITERRRAEIALRAADRRKDEFLATLAHELRNPLAPIRNALSILRLKAPQDPDLREAREMMERQVAHMVRLVDDLLDVSRITFGKVELRRETLDLRAVAEEAVAASKPGLDEAGHQLTLRLGPDPLWVRGDRVRLAQVVSNLLNNASRYTRRGGEILLAADRAQGDARLCVKDNGMGIAPELLEGIFEAFAQGGAPGAGGGIGIGLTLSRKLVELHGGTIVAESEGPGRGSRFTVRLPLAAQGATDAGPPLEPSSLAHHRFLVVDDNADAARSQADLLRLLGHEAEVANDGEDALRKAARYRPEIVLLDIGMPGMDGFEVARRLRAMPEAREATLIAQSGFGQPEDRLRSEAAGFDAHLAKPAEVSAILEAAARARSATRAVPG